MDGSSGPASGCETENCDLTITHGDGLWCSGIWQLVYEIAKLTYIQFGEVGLIMGR